jgi:uncharacterized membrane protein (DUF373 family)
MDTFGTIKRHYNFTSDDEKRIQSLYPLVEERAESIIRHLERHIVEMADSQIIETKNRHPQLAKFHQQWLLRLFRGPYDSGFHKYLVRIGKVHAAKGISPHFVIASMNMIRTRLIDIVSENIEDREQQSNARKALNKLLDINLDVITRAYVEEEIQQYSTAYRLKSSLVTFAERFSGAMNLILVFSLIIITLGVVGLFVHDLTTLFRGNISQGIITALGSLLILWVLIELMNTEISHLKGSRFNISVFIGVALVTLIRDLMIATLKHEKIDTAYYLVVAILVLGLVYWLVVRSEARRQE